MTDETILEVTRELIGPIQPVGDCAVDAKRIINLRKTMAVARGLLDDIYWVADGDRDRQHSVREAGKEASEWLHELIVDLQVGEEDDA